MVPSITARRRHRRPSGPWHAAVVVALTSVLLAACAASSPSASTSVEPSTTSAVAPSVAASIAPSVVPSQQPASAAVASASAAAGGPCVDVGELADIGDPVVTSLGALTTALAAKKLDDARSAAQTAGKGMKSMADLVAAASPQAKQLFLTAATELAQAVLQFPNGGAVVQQARKDLDQAFVIAEAARCPE